MIDIYTSISSTRVNDIIHIAIQDCDKGGGKTFLKMEIIYFRYKLFLSFIILVVQN